MCSLLFHAGMHKHTWKSQGMGWEKKMQIGDVFREANHIEAKESSAHIFQQKGSTLPCCFPLIHCQQIVVRNDIWVACGILPETRLRMRTRICCSNQAQRKGKPSVEACRTCLATMLAQRFSPSQGSHLSWCTQVTH